MTTAELYAASPIKRHRSTKAEVATRRYRLYEIVKAMRPMTVRQVFYQASVRGIVEKSEAGYNVVQTDLVLMRRAGFTRRVGAHHTRTDFLPYGWLADNTRWQRKPNTFTSIQEALDETARFYRKALWTDANYVVPGIVGDCTSVRRLTQAYARSRTALVIQTTSRSIVESSKHSPAGT